MENNITFSMIKPHAVKANNIGNILSMMEKAGFEVIAAQYTELSKAEAQKFYGIHNDKPFFDKLCNIMSSGPIMALVLKKENAVADFRKFIGSTNPQEAAEGTIRKIYGNSLDENAVHGSDSPENALIEAQFFFSMRNL